MLLGLSPIQYVEVGALMGPIGRGAVVAAIGGCLMLVATFRGHEALEPLPVYWDQELQEMVRWNPAEVEVARRAERKRMVHLEARPEELEDDGGLTALCEGYARAAGRVIRNWYREPEAEPPKEHTRGQLPAVGGPNAWSALGGSRMDDAPEVEARCSWRELNLVVDFPQISDYFDPEIMLGSILDGLRRDEGLDAYADRMKVVVEDVDTGFYAAFDPRD